MAKAFECFVEIDETYIGGKPRKTNTATDANGNLIPKAKRGRGTDKTPVIGIKERGAKRVYAQAAMPNAQGQNYRVGNYYMSLIRFVKKERL
jgi:hypothetical protein